jgi:hypothetical protein
MNIFATSDCPIISAKQLCNVHARRMPLESAGMLVFAFPENTTPIPNQHSKSHYKHPCSIWTRASRENFEWLLAHALEQSSEYTRRYKREHASEKHIKWCRDNYDTIQFPSIGRTPFARCFGEFKLELDIRIKNAIDAYRKFYQLDKLEFARWPSQSEIPDWWIDQSDKWVDPNFINGSYTKR